MKSTPEVSPHRLRAWSIAAWPALAGTVYATYAVIPGQFPADTGYLLAMLMISEFIVLLTAVGHAMALGERDRRIRYLVYALGLIVPSPLFWMFEPEHFMPMVGWVLIGQCIALWSQDPDPELARARAFAILNDKGTLLELVPVVVVGGFLTLGLAVWIGGYFDLDLERWLRDHGQSSWVAFAGAVYLWMGAWISAHAHGPVFARERRRLLDRPALRAISRFLSRGSSAPRDL